MRTLGLIINLFSASGLIATLSHRLGLTVNLSHTRGHAAILPLTLGNIIALSPHSRPITNTDYAVQLFGFCPAPARLGKIALKRVFEASNGSQKEGGTLGKKVVSCWS